MTRRILVILMVGVCLVRAAPAGADVFDMPDGLTSLEVVTVGNLGNIANLYGHGAVDYVYNIGKFEVTAGQYAEFLNAVAKSDPYGLYNGSMDSSSYGCQITRNGADGSYTYDFSGRPSGDESDWVNRSVNYVSWGDAARFANWLTNGQPTGAQGLATTEDGSYYLNGATSAADLDPVTRKANARYVIPSADEWCKAAYHKNDGVTGNYWTYPTGTDAPPSNDLVGPDAGNNANFYVDPNDYTIGPPYWRSEVEEFENSESPYGTFDQGGNVWEWTEEVSGLVGFARGGSFADNWLNLHMGAGSLNSLHVEASWLGLRVAEVPGPATLSLLGLGTIGVLRRRK